MVDKVLDDAIVPELGKDFEFDFLDGADYPTPLHLIDKHSCCEQLGLTNLLA
jgi:hypothetical protein